MAADNNLNKPNEADITNEISKVSTNQAKNIILLGLILIIFLLIFYNYFVKENVDQNAKKVTPKLNLTEIVKPNSKINDLPEVPKLPEPKLVEPVVLPPPLPAIIEPKPVIPPALPPPPSLPPAPINNLPNTPTILEDKDAAARREAKRKSSIVIKDSSTTADVKESVVSATVVVIEPLPLEYMLGRGKIIDAVLESAINTDFGGEVRAIVSRDVFSESGQHILIPKGSRLFGTYSTGTESIYGRIQIIWDSISITGGGGIKLNAYAIDNLGRKGVEGRVDNKYTEKMTNAVLTSVFDVLTAQITDQLVPPVTSNQAATTAQATSTNITSAVNTLLTDSTKTAADVCTAIRNAFADKTMTSYTQADSSCNSIISGSYASEADRKTAAANLAATTASSLLTAATQTTTATKAQKAAQDGYKNISDTFKDILQQKKNFMPTISIDQGKPIKIYVNANYLFPKNFVTKSKMVDQ